MKTIKMLLAFTIFLGLVGFVPNGGQRLVSDTHPTIDDLIGTWELVSFKYGEEQSFSPRPDFIGYRKLITPTHFVYVSFEEGKEAIDYAGGGTFTLKDGIYTEHIEFYYPGDSKLLGSAMPFQCKIQDKRWHHSGYIIEREFDIDKGVYKVVKRQRIEEIWQRVD
ncbi:hypothetical protein AAG747_25950 [Rapidithrix thailandica]|uniref:DUF4488 domain-containing protein n=1 Tax=Rapidithrix thailandica TaxID=413964 RepID=A0AAW9SED0_9BACT